MSMTSKEKVYLRELARRLAEIAHLPVMAERRAMWKRHNRLERVRPMVLVFAEGGWSELLPEDALCCEDETARAMEWRLRQQIYWHEYIPDDWVFEPEWVVDKVYSNSGWGLEPKYKDRTTDRGSWGFDPVIQTADDLNKLRFPEVRYDAEQTEAALTEAHDVFDGILEVKCKGITHMSFHLMATYCRLRGLEQVMADMCEAPEMLHAAMAFLEEGHQRLIAQYNEQGLLELNNDNSYHSSGGVGFSDELPPDDVDPGHLRPCDIWASAEAQELAQVGPDMHEEFSLQYERRLLAPFGLNGYGCCEDLTQKLDKVFTIPNLRRISISPFADVDACAEKLADKYIYSWKPQPAHIVGGFDEDLVRAYLTHTLETTRNSVVEIILKDTHTCEHQPGRFTRWAEIAGELVQGY
jgi:hypothetical protein